MKTGSYGWEGWRVDVAEKEAGRVEELEKRVPDDVRGENVGSVRDMDGLDVDETRGRRTIKELEEGHEVQRVELVPGKADLSRNEKRTDAVVRSGSLRELTRGRERNGGEAGERLGRTAYRDWQ